MSNRCDRRARWRFVLTICVGSFLLFLVQPMVARMALPLLGGAPSVWNSAMLVYQALLLAGYAYAHWLGRFGGRMQAAIHIALFLFAALTLPIALAELKLLPDASPFVRVPLMLLASIGPLFFVVAAQAPLMQRWFTLSGGKDPYPLYAASNAGSFAGLLSYPLIVEPLLSAGAQSRLWSIGYGLLLLLIVRAAFALPQGGAIHATEPDLAPPSRKAFFGWVLFAAVPSGLLLSTTLHLTTDIVAMPLLWVLPLGLYLLSFSVAFASDQRLARGISLLAPFALLAGAAAAFIDSTAYPFAMAGLTLASLFVLAVTLHSEMFRTRPDPAHLTHFYLAMSIGGVLGGIFCALIAPVIFDWTYEHPILLGLTALLLPPRAIFRSGSWLARQGRWTIGALGAAVLLVSPIGLQGEIGRFAGAVAIIIFALAALGERRLFACSLVALMLCLNGWGKVALSLQGDVLSRSYFGVYAIRASGAHSISLVHGTTVHGIQDVTPGRERLPTTYYAPPSGVGLAMMSAPGMFGPQVRIDVVGLGLGTLACYAQPGQRWRFYEIDPLIERIARDTRYFTFLANCLPDPDVRIGDARLTLAQEPPRSADLLVIDAFSSDSVPMHLLTREAFAVYRRHLAPHGMLLVHISNRYLDLRPVIAAAAKAGGWYVAERLYEPDEASQALNQTASRWIALSPDRTVIARLRALSPPEAWSDLEGRPGFSAWTDDHATILSILNFGQ